MATKTKKIRNRIYRLLGKIRGYPYRNMKSPDSYPAGSKKWLIATEKKYGGRVEIPIPTNRCFSPNDPRNTPGNTKRRLNNGGDKMIWNCYSPHYARYLKRFVANRFAEFAIAEVGVLSGASLALWSDLFPKSDIFGLDMNLSTFRENEAHLKSLGAFPDNFPTLIEYDQFAEPTADIITALGGTRFSIIIDDASHHRDGILNTIDLMREHLAEDFLYFIEDNAYIEKEVRLKFPDTHVARYGRLTVVDGSR